MSAGADRKLGKHLEEAQQQEAMWRRAARAALAVLVVIGLLAVFVRAVLEMDTGDRIGYAATLVVIIVLGVTAARSERFEQRIERAFGAYFVAMAWLSVALAPVWLAYAAGQLIGERLPGWLQLVALLLFGAVLFAGLVAAATPNRRENLFQRLRRAGRLTPWVYTVDLLVIAGVFFGTLTFVLHQRGLVSFTGAQTALTGGRLTDFYLWHFAEAIPLLSVPETLGWERPLDYQHAGVGWLVLTFKVAVIVPLIAVFRAYWELTHTAPSPTTTS